MRLRVSWRPTRCGFCGKRHAIESCQSYATFRELFSGTVTPEDHEKAQQDRWSWPGPRRSQWAGITRLFKSEDNL